MYYHVGISARYSGALRFDGEEREVSGLCSFEHAQAVTAGSLLDRVVPGALKVPIDLFTYQVVKLDPDTLLLLTHVLVAGLPLFNSAFLKQVRR